MAEAQSEKEGKEGKAENEKSGNGSPDSSLSTPLTEDHEQDPGEELAPQVSQDSQPAEIALSSTGFLDSSLLGNVKANWETVAWAVILIVAVVSRFYALGARGMSHDESLHALYSLDLYRSGSYQHNPDDAWAVPFPCQRLHLFFVWRQ